MTVAFKSASANWRMRLTRTNPVSGLAEGDVPGGGSLSAQPSGHGQRCEWPGCGLTARGYVELERNGKWFWGCDEHLERTREALHEREERKLQRQRARRVMKKAQTQLFYDDSALQEGQEYSGGTWKTRDQ